MSTPCRAARALSARYTGLLAERKRSSMALHFRLAPHLEAECVRTMEDAVKHVPGLKLLRGKAVREAKSSQVGKGRAIDALMSGPPFAGRKPVFAGDDVTDTTTPTPVNPAEAGFAPPAEATLSLGVVGNCAFSAPIGPRGCVVWCVNCPSASATPCPVTGAWGRCAWATRPFTAGA
jgi:hypothetical protein